MFYNLRLAAEAADATPARRFTLDRKWLMEEQKKPERQPKVYEPPKVIRVTLRPEEAVLGHCKVSGSAGFAQSTCDAVVTCRSLGS